MSSLLDIANGWYNYISSTVYIKELMATRLAICDNCPNKVQLNSLGKLVVSIINNEGNLFKCAKCNCPLSAKTANPASVCPINLWGIAGSN